MSASDKQHGGGHYAKLPTEMQPWNVLQHWLTPEEYRGWQKGVAIVYLARERDKGGDLDIQKAAHHLERLMEEFQPSVGGPTGMQADDGWIEWRGGEQPLPAVQLVDIRVKDGLIGRAICCGMLRWGHADHPGDIIAYRVVKA